MDPKASPMSPIAAASSSSSCLANDMTTKNMGSVSRLMSSRKSAENLQCREGALTVGCHNPVDHPLGQRRSYQYCEVVQ